MSTQLLSNLLADLSAEQQQLLAGGYGPGEDGGDNGGEDGGEVQNIPSDRGGNEEQGTSFGLRIGTTRLYRVRSQALVRVTRIR